MPLTTRTSVNSFLPGPNRRRGKDGHAASVLCQDGVRNGREYRDETNRMNMSPRATAQPFAGRRPREITAAVEIGASRRTLFAFLAEPDNHRLLTSDKLELIELSRKGDTAIAGVVMLKGPVGIRRRASIWTSTWRPLESIGGSAVVGRSTVVDVSWHLLTTIKGATKVVLTARVVQAAAIDRLLLWLGGEAWAERLFRDTLAILAAAIAADAITQAQRAAPSDPPAGDQAIELTPSTAP